MMYSLFYLHYLHPKTQLMCCTSRAVNPPIVRHYTFVRQYVTRPSKKRHAKVEAAIDHRIIGLICSSRPSGPPCRSSALESSIRLAYAAAVGRGRTE